MTEQRLQRTRVAYDDPQQRLAKIYLKHARGLISMGQMVDAQRAIEEAARLLGTDEDGVVCR